MIPLPARLALQVGLVFCVIAAALGLGADLGVATVIMRSALCGVAGAAIGASTGGLLLWLDKIASDQPDMPADDPLATLPEAGQPEAALPAPDAPALSEGQPGG